MQPTSRVSILVAEDDVDIGALLRSIFQEEQGWSTTLVNNAEAALDRMRQSQFDVLVVDYGLPRLTGLQLLAQLREDPSWDNPCVIMISALREHPAIAAALRAGLVHRFVPKPFDLDQVVNAVKMLTDGSVHRDQPSRQGGGAQASNAPY